MPDDVVEVTPEQAAAELLGTAAPSTEQQTTEAKESTAPASEAQAEEASEVAESRPAEGVLSPLLKKLIDSKYGGDQEKFLAGIYEGWNSTSRLAKQLEDLQQKMTTKEEEPPDPATLNPAIPVLTKQLTTLTTRFQSNEEKRNQILLDANKLNLEIAKVQGELSRADDFEKGTLTDRIERLTSRRESLHDKWNTLAEMNEQLDYQRQELEQRLEEAGKLADQVRVRQIEEQGETTALKQRTISDFVDGVQEAAKSLGIEEGSDIFGHMANTIRAEATAYLRSMPDGPPIDIKAFVKARAEVYGKVLGLAKGKELRQLGAEKLQATTKSQVAPVQPLAARVAAAKQVASPAPKSAAEARAWAAKVLEGR